MAFGSAEAHSRTPLTHCVLRRRGGVLNAPMTDEPERERVQLRFEGVARRRSLRRAVPLKFRGLLHRSGSVVRSLREDFEVHPFGLAKRYLVVRTVWHCKLPTGLDLLSARASCEHAGTARSSSPYQALDPLRNTHLAFWVHIKPSRRCRSSYDSWGRGVVTCQTVLATCRAAQSRTLQGVLGAFL